MSVRVKSRRRLFTLLISFVLVVGAGVVVYVVRTRQITTRAIAARGEGMAALDKGDYFTALHRIGLYVQRFPDDAEALYAYARARKHVQEPDNRHIVEAMAMVRRATELKPDNLEYWHALVGMYDAVGFNSETVTTADNILGRFKDDPDAMRAKVNALRRLRQYDKAQELAERYNQLHPEDVGMQAMTLMLMAQQRQPADKIVGRANAAAKGHDNDARFELLQSIAYRVTNNPKEADNFVGQALVHYNGDPSLAPMLAQQLDNLERFDDAVAVLRQADKAPNSPTRWLLTERLFQNEQYAEVLTRLSSLDVNDRNTDAEMLSLRAVSLLKLGQKPQAQAIIDTLSARESDPSAAVWSAVLKAQFGSDQPQPRQVIRAAQAGLVRSPQNPYFHYYLGEAYSRIGETNLAETEWSKALAVSESWAAPLAREAELLTSLLYAQEAVQVAQSAQRRAPHDPAVLLTLARAQVQTIDSTHTQAADGLLQLLDEIDKIQGDNGETLPLRVRTLAQSGRRNAAADALRAALNEAKPMEQRVLLSLAVISRQLKLGLEQDCLNLAEKQGGLTSEIAYVRACDDLDEGKPQDGLKRLDAARQQHAADPAWRLAWARYLDLIQDPRAKQEWVALGDQEPNNLDVQWSALGARAAQQDHDFLGRTIDRLRAQVGEEGLTWRIARAKWLLNGNPGPKETAEAMLILNDVTRAAPNMLSPRLLLATCMQRAGNLTGAIDQLATAAKLDPSSNTIALQLVGLLQQQGDFGRASEYLGKVIDPRNQSTTPWERRTAAMLLARQGNSDQALKMLQDVDQKTGDAQATDTMLASLYASRGEPDKAEKIYRKLLEKPTTQAIQIVSDFYVSQGRTADADATLALLDKLQLKPGVKDFILGEHYRVRGDERQALDHLKAAASADPKNPQFWRQWVNAEVRFGHPAEALAAARQASAALGEPGVFQRLLDAAAPVAAVGDEPIARQLVLQLLDGDADDGSAAALQLLADAKAQKQDLTAALPQLRPLADKHPQVQPLQNVTARLDLAAAAYDDAVTVATRAMQAFPNAVEPAQIAEAALTTSGRWSEALGVAEQWRQRSLARPLEPDLAIARAALAQGDAARALRQLQPYLSRAQAGEPSLAPALALAAQAQVASGKADDAAKLLRPLLDKSPAWRVAWMEMASIQVPDKAAAARWLDQVAPLIPADGAAERAQLAMSWYRLSQRSKDPAQVEKYKSLLAQTAAELQSASSPPASAVLTLGILQEESGDQAAAEKSYRRALAADPNLPVAQNNLAMIILRRGGDLKEAADLAEKAAQSRDPNAASFWETLASIHAKMNDRDKSAAEYRTAIKLAPDRVAWRISLAEVLADGGHPADARSVLQNVQSDDPRLTDAARQRLSALLARLSTDSAGSRPARVSDAK